MSSHLEYRKVEFDAWQILSRLRSVPGSSDSRDPIQIERWLIADIDGTWTWRKVVVSGGVLLGEVTHRA